MYVTTTLHLTDEELADLQQLTNQTDPAEAVRAAMHDFVRYVRRIQLKTLSGQVRIQDNWQAMEAAEMESQFDAKASLHLIQQIGMTSNRGHQLTPNDIPRLPHTGPPEPREDVIFQMRATGAGFFAMDH